MQTTTKEQPVSTSTPRAVQGTGVCIGGNILADGTHVFLHVRGREVRELRARRLDDRRFAVRRTGSERTHFVQILPSGNLRCSCERGGLGDYATDAVTALIAEEQAVGAEEAATAARGLLKLAGVSTIPFAPSAWDGRD